jgi:hypothetical protein
MAGNRRIYSHCISKNIPILILEVGTLIRNQTWKLSLTNINSLGYFGTDIELDMLRPEKLGIELRPYLENRNRNILITTQRPESLQWANQPEVEDWINDTVIRIKKVTDRPIVVRPHPRYTFKKPLYGVTVERPRKIENTYDDYDLKFNHHVMVHYNSGVSVQSLINGCPIICDASSLAAPLSNQLSDIENLKYSNREQWFIEICHTEWTVDEIQKGLPLARLLPKITKTC